MTMRRDMSRAKDGLLKGDAVRNGGPVRIPAAPLPSPRPPERHDEEDGEPEVELHRGPDGAVSAISVRCPCGREITLQCEYLNGADEDEN